MEIWPAGPPKLINPSLSQNQKAWVKETGFGTSSEASGGIFTSEPCEESLSELADEDVCGFICVAS